MKRIPVTPADKLTEVLKASIRLERIIKENQKDFKKAQTMRKKLRDLMDKYSK